MRSCPKGKHIIQLSQNWSNALKQGLVDSTTEIATQCGLTPERVRQIVRLAKIDPKIAEFLVGLSDPKTSKRFLESYLRKIVSLPPHEQCRQFEELFGVTLPV